MSGTSSFRRNPLVIRGNHLSSGDRSTTFASGSPDSLLRNYLILVRDLRGQRREPSIELRTEDVKVIARHLGVSAELVLDGLLDLMGATRAQRSAMAALLAAGALTLVLTGSFVTDLSTDGVSVEMTRLADAVQTVVSGDELVAGPASVASFGAPERPETSESHARAVDTPTVDVLRSVHGASRSTNESASAPSATEGDATAVAADHAPAQVAGEPVSIAVAADGSLVASVAPPTPPADAEQTATGELPDGTTVGVTAPPVPTPPAPEQTATGELPDGTTVGVTAPPVPQSPAG